ncbi:MAG: transcriptional regulator [Candidatus Glassbacteria bacterium RIFCSPLOWO2_12_FULL_58_11]|uniref:Transcriptional regulator n=1 Tax=Candidatus Glassbacteria bacterium RIFCSPLOWO2_12_FULL_58_11 TaxID=1817867 RepID=A0A1F5YXB2_9BACT|nr:MAG: transcriptional regulator [Candidatus Glassbacteria bacterium RIFCSPLOWO2_12_FULL_58_11]
MRIEDEIRQNKFRSERQKLIINISFTSNWINSHVLRFLKPFGISPEQYNVLRILRGQHPAPATVNLVRDRMINRMSNASRLVEKLRRKGLVERTVCDQDRRAVDLLITGAGLDLLKQIDSETNKLEKLFETVTREEAMKMNFLLDKLRS